MPFKKKVRHRTVCWGLALLLLSPVVGCFIINYEFVKDHCLRKIISNGSLFNSMVLGYFNHFKLHNHRK